MTGPSTLRRESAGPTSSRSLALWFGVLGPPIAWSAHLLLSDGLYELGCAPGFGRPEIYGLSLHLWALLETAFLLAVDVAAGMGAFRAYRRIRTEQAAGETARDRATGMAVAGIASSVLYGLILLYGLFPPIVFDPCRVAI